MMQTQITLTSNNIYWGDFCWGKIISDKSTFSLVPRTKRNIFHLYGDGLGFNSYNVERFKMKVAVTNEYGDPIYMMSPGDTIFLKTCIYQPEVFQVLEKSLQEHKSEHLLYTIQNLNLAHTRKLFILLSEYIFRIQLIP